ncbi:MAG TPA: ester cyclase [Roseiflexaceae bacterium]|nr:ester cyclase [Roseiflexaceae bacterium]
MSARQPADANKALLQGLGRRAWSGDLSESAKHPAYVQSIQIFPLILAAFHKIEDVVEQQIGEGDFIFTYNSMRLVHHGPMIDVAPTGRQVLMTHCSLDEIRDGVVVQHNGASTWPDVLRQIGAPYLATWPPAPDPEPLAIGEPGGMRAEERKAIVSALLRALSVGELSDEYPGARALRAEFAAIRGAFPDAQLTIVRQIAEGDLVGTRATLEGTHTGALHGLVPTSRPVRWDMFSLDRVVDGQVVEHRGTVDWMDVLGKIGAIPPPPGSH